MESEKDLRKERPKLRKKNKKSVKKFHSIKSTDSIPKKKTKMKYDNKLEKQLSNYANKNSVSLFNEKSVRGRQSETLASEENDHSLFSKPFIKEQTYKSDHIVLKNQAPSPKTSAISFNLPLPAKNEEKENFSKTSSFEFEEEINKSKRKKKIEKASSTLNKKAKEKPKKNMHIQYTFGEEEDANKSFEEPLENMIVRARTMEDEESEMKDKEKRISEEILNNIKKKTGEFEGIKEEENEDDADDLENKIMRKVNLICETPNKMDEEIEIIDIVGIPKLEVNKNKVVEKEKKYVTNKETESEQDEMNYNEVKYDKKVNNNNEIKNKNKHKNDNEHKKNNELKVYNKLEENNEIKNNNEIKKTHTKQNLSIQTNEKMTSPPKSRKLLAKQFTATDMIMEEVRKSVRKDTEKVKSAKLADEEIQKEIKSYLKKGTISDFSQITNQTLQSPENLKKKNQIKQTQSERSHHKIAEIKKIKSFNTETNGVVNPPPTAQQFPDVAQMLEDIKKNVFEGYNGIHNTQGIPEGSQGDGFKEVKELRKAASLSRSGSRKLQKYDHDKDPKNASLSSKGKFKSNLKKSNHDSAYSKTSNKGSFYSKKPSAKRYDSVNRQISSINKKLDILTKLNHESENELKNYTKKMKSLRPSRQQFKPKSKDKRTTFPPIKPKRKKISEFKVEKKTRPTMSTNQKKAQLQAKGSFENINFNDDGVLTKGMISDDSIKIFQVTDDEQEDEPLKMAKSSDAESRKKKLLPTSKINRTSFRHIKSKINTNLDNALKSKSPKSRNSQLSSKKKSGFTNRKMSAPAQTKPKVKRKPPLPLFQTPKVPLQGLKKMVRESITKDKDEYWKNRSLSSYRLKYRNDQHKVMKKRYFLNSNRRNTTVESIHLADKTRVSNPLSGQPSPPKPVVAPRSPYLRLSDSQIRKQQIQEMFDSKKIKREQLERQEELFMKLRNSSVHSTGNHRHSASRNSLLSQSFNRILSSKNKAKFSASRMVDSQMKSSAIDKM